MTRSQEIVAAARRRPDGAVLPLPVDLKVGRARLAELVERGVLEEREVPKHAEGWRADDQGVRFGLFATGPEPPAMSARLPAWNHRESPWARLNR